MTTTREEALEQGWREPAPTFFGDDAQAYFGKCNQSPWTLIRRTEPKPVLNTEHPAVKALLERDPELKKSSPEVIALLPHIQPRPRPFQFLHFGSLR